MNHKKQKKMKHGWYAVDIPEGATEIESVNNEEVNEDFTAYEGQVGGTYYPETPTEYGLFVWNDEEPVIESVVIDETAVEVQLLLGGHHPSQRPK